MLNKTKNTINKGVSTMTIKKFMLIPTAVVLLGLVQAPSTFATTSNGVQQSVVQATATLLTVTGAKTVSTSASSTTTTWNKLTGITNYDLYQATSIDGKYSYIAKLGNVSSYTVNGLTKGHTYYYKVRANKIVSGKNIYSNTTTFSEISSATVGSTTVTPVTSPITATVKSASFGAVINVTSTQIGAVKYQVYDGTSILSATANLGTNTTIFPAKVNGDTVTIKLFDASGNLLTTVNVVLGQSGTTSDLLTVDETQTVATSPTSTTTTWSLLSGVDGYDIYQATSLNGAYSFIARRANTVSSFALKGLTTNKTYYYKVRAYKFINGVNEYSNTDTFSSITYATIGTAPVETADVTTTVKSASFGAAANVTLTADGVKAYPLATQYQIVIGTSNLSAVSPVGTSTTIFPAKAVGDVVSVKLLDASNNLLTTIDVVLGQ